MLNTRSECPTVSRTGRVVSDQNPWKTLEKRCTLLHQHTDLVDTGLREKNKTVSTDANTDYGALVREVVAKGGIVVDLRSQECGMQECTSYCSKNCIHHVREPTNSPFLPSSP